MRWMGLGLIVVFLSSVLLADRVPLPKDEVRVFEPGQYAVIAFNGEEELLYLTTKVRASSKTKAIQLIPFPTRPEVNKGDLSVLQSIQSFLWPRVWRVRGWVNAHNAARAIQEAVTVLAQQRIGSHNLTILKANEKKTLYEWLRKKIGKDVENRKWFKIFRDVINHYHACGFRYWVLDEIELQTNNRFVEPLVYRFRCPFMYYPLVISAPVEGETTITIAAFSVDAAPFVEAMPDGFQDALMMPNGRRGTLTLSSDQLRTIWAAAAELFGSGESVELCIYTYRGKVRFESDIPETISMRKRVARLFEHIAKTSKDAEPEVAWVLADLAKDYLFAQPGKEKLIDQMRARCEKPPTTAKREVVAAIKRGLGYVICGMKDFGLATLRGVSARSMPKHYLNAVRFLISTLKKF